MVRGVVCVTWEICGLVSGVITVRRRDPRAWLEMSGLMDGCVVWGGRVREGPVKDAFERGGGGGKRQCAGKVAERYTEGGGRCEGKEWIGRAGPGREYSRSKKRGMCRWDDMADCEVGVEGGKVVVCWLGVLFVVSGGGGVRCGNAATFASLFGESVDNDLAWCRYFIPDLRAVGLLFVVGLVKSLCRIAWYLAWWVLCLVFALRAAGSLSRTALQGIDKPSVQRSVRRIDFTEYTVLFGITDTLFRLHQSIRCLTRRFDTSYPTGGYGVSVDLPEQST
ncbi:hypothetical protein Tco_1044654 [Tanacetum coccineum]|uniref:Uncharacterized protein n=1 Tax=Tanacetum coccineum TaxID=301880 RepID=A0ABQ5GRP8_9ASTR